MKKRSQLGMKATCPCIGVLCFLFAFFAGILATKPASADTPVPAIKGTPLVVPAAVLGVSNPYLIAAAVQPQEPVFILSREIRDLAERVQKAARYGLDLNQRTPQPDKLQLRLQPRGMGGVLQICYRH